MTTHKRTPSFLSVTAPLLWAGMVIGISFLEAPLKFQAPGVSLEISVGIGRLVFGALNKAEWVLLSLWLTALVASKEVKCALDHVSIAFMLLLLQTFWLLPILDARATLILAGTVPPPSNHHHFFVIGELFKMVVLIHSVYHLLKVAPNHSFQLSNNLSS